MQMRREAVRSHSVAMMNILVPKLRKPTRRELCARFPEMQISEMEERSIDGLCRVEAERLATSPLPEVDSERYDRNLVDLGVAGCQQALWLFEHKPPALLQLLEAGNSLEFPGTRVFCKGGRKLRNPRLHIVKGPERFILYMPRMDNGTHFRLLWTLLGAGDREHATRFARAYPM
ncbi:MAG: hypothetical protein AAB534_01635 [Patescibacteria group bacterium]